MSTSELENTLNSLLTYIPYRWREIDSGEYEEAGESADRLVDLAAKFMRALDATAADTVRQRAQEFESLTGPGSPLDLAREKTEAEGRRIIEVSGKPPADSSYFRAAAPRWKGWTIYPYQSLPTIEEIRWELLGGAPKPLGKFAGLVVKSKAVAESHYTEFHSRFSDKVWQLKLREEKDQLWGCFLLFQCWSVAKDDRIDYCCLISRFKTGLSAKSQAIQDAANYLRLLPNHSSATSDVGNDTPPNRVPVTETGLQEPVQTGDAARAVSDHLTPVIRSVTVTLGEERYALTAESVQPFSMSPTHSEVFGLFVRKILKNVPSELVGWKELNHAMGEQKPDPDKACGLLRTALNDLRAKLETWGTPPDKKAWIATTKGKGLCLNEIIEWKITPELREILTKRQSPWDFPTDPDTMAENTDSSGNQVPDYRKHAHHSEYESDDAFE